MMLEVLEILEQMLVELNKDESEVISLTAQIWGKMYNALLAEGFTQGQAMELMKAHQPFNLSGT